MKRVFAVLILFSMMMTAVPSMAEKQKSIPGTSLRDAYNGMFLIENASHDQNYLYNEDGKLVMKSPGNGVKLVVNAGHDYTGRNYIFNGVVVDGKCIMVTTYDEKAKRWKYGLISTKGKVLCKCKYDEIGLFSEGIAVVKQGEKYGFINTSGKLIGKCQWDYADSFYNGMAEVRKGKNNCKYGFINTRGELIGGILWDSVSRFDNSGTIRVMKGDKYHLIDKKGKTISKNYNFMGWESQDGYIEVTADGGSGLIDSKGHEVIKCQYFDANLCGEGIVFLKDNKGATTLRTLKGKILNKTIKWTRGTYHEGLMFAEAFGTDRKLHLVAVNKKGKIVLDTGLDPFFYSCGGFKNGLAKITSTKNSAWGYINKKGEWVIKLKSRKYMPATLDSWLNNKLIKIQAVGESQPKYGVMNAKGKVLLKCEYADISPLADGLFTVLKYNNQYGLMNAKGEIVASGEWIEYKNGLVAVCNQKGKLACLNVKGKTILPAKYNNIVIGDKVILAEKDQQILFFDLKGKPIMEKEAPARTPAPEQEKTPAENTETPPDTGEAA